MKLDALIRTQYLVWILLLSSFQLSCVDEVTESDCNRVQQQAIKFVEQSIFPLVDSKSSPKIDRLMVERLKGIREGVGACAMRDAPDDATRSNEVDFLRLDRELSFFEVTLEQALDDDPEIAEAMTRILVNSRSFREAVQDLRVTLGLEDSS